MKVLEVNVDDIGMGGVFSLVKNVIRHNQGNIHIDIATLEPFENYSNIEELEGYGCTVHYVGYKKSKLIKQLVCLIKLKRVVKDYGYTCVHIHADVANKLFVSGLACKLAGIKKILLHSHASSVDGNHRIAKRIFHYTCRRLLKYIGTEFLTCSDLAAKWMYPNIDADSIIHVNNGIDLLKFRYNETIRDRMRKELGLEGKYVIGHVGRFAYQKNHKYLISVFKQVKKTEENTMLLLIGDGVLKDEIMAQIAEWNLTDDVIFYGVSNHVEELFQCMDIFVLPSHFEGLPIVGVEAQASGLPVLFSDKITKTAKVIDDVNFLPIEEDDVSKWVNLIKDYKDKKRYDTYQQLKDCGFDASDTVMQLSQLYNQ